MILPDSPVVLSTEMICSPGIILLVAAMFCGLLFLWAGIFKRQISEAIFKMLASIPLFLSGLACIGLGFKIGTYKGFLSKPGIDDWESVSQSSLLEINSMSLIFCAMGLVWIGILSMAIDQKDYPSPLLRLLQGMGLWGTFSSGDLVTAVIFFAIFSAAQHALDANPKKALWQNLVPMIIFISGCIFLVGHWGGAYFPELSTETLTLETPFLARAGFACFLSGLVLWAIRIGGNLSLFLVFGFVLRVAVRMPLESYVFIQVWACLLILGQCFRLLQAKKAIDFLTASGGYLIGFAALFAAVALHSGSSEMGWYVFRALWGALWVSCISQILSSSNNTADGVEDWGWWPLVLFLAGAALPPGGAFFGVLNLAINQDGWPLLIIIVWFLGVSKAFQFMWKQAGVTPRKMLRSKGSARVWIWITSGAIVFEGLFSGLSRTLLFDAGAMLSGH